jgi:hypothetical protein
MSLTGDPIASITLVSAAASVTFSGIPQTYTDLVVVAQFGGATAGATLRVRFNDDSGSNYSYTQVNGDGSVAGSGRVSSGTSGGLGLTSQGSTTTLESMVVAHICSYANTNVFKSSLGAGAVPARAVDRVVSLWRSTSAITSITMSLGVSFPTHNLVAGSTFDLYGLRGA